MPIDAPMHCTYTDRSGTTSGSAGTSTQLMAANANREYFFVQNVHATAIMWINFTSAATQGSGSIKLKPGEAYECPPDVCTTEAISIVSDTNSATYTAKEV